MLPSFVGPQPQFWFSADILLKDAEQPLGQLALFAGTWFGFDQLKGDLIITPLDLIDMPEDDGTLMLNSIFLGTV